MHTEIEVKFCARVDVKKRGGGIVMCELCLTKWQFGRILFEFLPFVHKRRQMTPLLYSYIVAIRDGRLRCP
jgi:hypothetical protein